MPSLEYYFCAFSYAITLMKDSLGARPPSSAAFTPLSCTPSHLVMQSLCLCEMSREANTMFHGQSSHVPPQIYPECLSSFCPVTAGLQKSLLHMVTGMVEEETDGRGDHNTHYLEMTITARRAFPFWSLCDQR